MPGHVERLLARLLPTALRWSTPTTLERVNASLQREIAARERAEAELRRSQELLESRVAERTRELETAYRSLRETQQASLQQERLRSLGRMARGIAHDLNNALTPATLYTQSLLDHGRSLSPEIRSELRLIQQAVQDATRTVARLKDFYRGRDANAIRAPIHIEALLEEVLDQTRSRWSDIPRSNGITIEVRKEYAARVPSIVGVEREIRDALVNLVRNAVDFMPAGGTLTLRSFGTPYQVTVEICDTGVGMSEEVRARCLDPFFTTRNARGAGLGLALVYGMAERHGAILEIDSAPGSGTVVRLVFPAAAPTIAVPRGSRRLRILVIDDDESLQQSMRTILERDGHHVSVVTGGREGIELFTASLDRGEPFDTVITDLAMPHIDGRGVASAIKRARPDVPVILLTGWGSQLGADKEVLADVDHLLEKPASLEQLRAVLASLEPGCGSEPLAAHGRD